MPKYALLDKSGKTRLTTEAPNLKAALKSLQADRNGTPIPAEWSIVKREVKPTTKPTTKPTAPEFKVGARVRVKASVGRPKYSWGGVKRGDVGIVRSIYGDGGLVIDFPAHARWLGASSDMELAPKKAEPKKAEPKKAEPKKLAPGHVTLRMNSGDTLEFWLEQDADGALDLRGRAQGRLPFYVASILPSGVLKRCGHLALPGLKLNAEGEVMM